MTSHPVRKRLRLQGYDYTQNGAYFVTVVTHERTLLFTDEIFRTIAQESWLWLAERYAYVGLDEFVVMPNHLHGIVILDGGGNQKRKPIGGLVGAFKTVSTKRINALRLTPDGVVWQRSFHERVVRNEAELNRIRQYVLDNPAQWGEDPENPQRVVVSGT